ncbi:hypothetical protein MVLG_05793 [Microbotryum lychnidis-dioicae p1A1 Lamole]|uniref:Uncharacterized protein n=1 Tax=Microbotryum lychnidis-dioicae (strain p1A1 Lamole / MvSl-1064) TaxID=683840 RepID=U5HFB5_USTV1|nr:hypothetical protein MVLG_05793 [Microbotryum lychnidis-dioicae p1A1 Lamole]|eukprot:KDE03723.1 hypothetical protein MVLG_05793 [Microbotryum lychnidis-dioicae p1A1 Lamole]
MSTLLSTLPSLSVWASLRAGRPSLAPSFATIAVRHDLNTSAMDLVVENRVDAASSDAKDTTRKKESVRTKAGPSEGTSPRKKPIEPHKVALTSHRYLWQTRDRWIARQLAAGADIPPDILSEILAHRKILAADMAIYVDVLARKDVYYAMESLGLLESAGPDRPQVQSPDWLILSIPGMLKTNQDVPYLASMLVRSRRFAQLNRENRALFIARCLESFLRIRHLVAVRETIDWVCSSPNQLGSATAFARILTVLAAGGNDTRKPISRSTAAPKELLHRARDRLLELMKAKGIEPTLDTTLPLLEPGLIPDDVHEIANLVVQTNRLGQKLRRGVLRRAMLSLLLAGNEEGATVFARSLEGISEEEDGAEGSVEDSESIFDATSTAFARLEEGRDLSGIVLAHNADVGEVIELFHRALDRQRTVAAPDAAPKSVSTADLTWARLFNFFHRSTKIQANELQDLLHQLESSSVQLHDLTWRRIYHGVMLGFLSRDDPDRVVWLWERVTRERPVSLSPNLHMLTVVMRAHCALGRPDRARAICDAWTIDAPREDTTARIEDEIPAASDSPPRCKGIKLTVDPLNDLMLYCSRTGAFGEVYALFKAMSSTYGVVPNSASLTILIQSARYASWHDPPGSAHSGTSLKYPVLWDNRDPVAFAEDLFWSVLEQNWPELAKNEVIDPFKSKTSRIMEKIFARSAAASGTAETNGEGGVDLRAFEATLSMVDPPRYPFLYPSAKTFRTFVILLGSTRRYEKIPLVLAWMKALKVRPNRHTLGLAMMWVAEMALADEEMVKWREWVKDWVGEEDVPREEEIAWLRRGRGWRGNG